MVHLRIKLPSQLDMAALPQLKEELVNALTSAGEVVVDGTDVERLGTPAAQLLLAAARECAAETRSFVLEAPSPALICAFDELGLGAEARGWSVA